MITNLSIEEMKKLIAQHEKNEQEIKKAEQKKVEQGWEGGKYIIKKVTFTLFFTKQKVSGWDIQQENSYNKERRGMRYFVTKEMIIIHYGGGYYTMQDCILIRPEEIEQLNNGEMPDRLKHNPNFEY